MVNFINIEKDKKYKEENLNENKNNVDYIILVIVIVLLILGFRVFFYEKRRGNKDKENIETLLNI